MKANSALFLPTRQKENELLLSTLIKRKLTLGKRDGFREEGESGE
jgi:hypothetical protein